MILQSVLSIEGLRGNIENQQLLGGVYQTLYGIFNHVANLKAPPSKRRPLASVAMHRGEDFTATSLLRSTMENYDELKIGEIFKIPYTEFMRQTVDIVEMMVDVAKKKREKEAKQTDQTLRATNNALNLKERQSAQLQNLFAGKPLHR